MAMTRATGTPCAAKGTRRVARIENAPQRCPPAVSRRVQAGLTKGPGGRPNTCGGASAPQGGP